MEITGSSRGQPTSVAQSFGVRRIHTFAWDVGILVSRRNWNIPRITWSIIPIVQEFQGGHATTKKEKYFRANPKQRRKKRWPLWPIADQSSEKQRQKCGCHSPVSPPRHDPHGGILRIPIATLPCWTGRPKNCPKSNLHTLLYPLNDRDPGKGYCLKQRCPPCPVR